LLATFKDVAKMFQVDFGPFDFQLFKVHHFSNGTADKASWHPVAIVELENGYCSTVDVAERRCTKKEAESGNGICS